MGHYRKKQITIFTTNSCNMRCIYCAANSSSYQDETYKINLKFAKRGIYDYFNNGENNQIRFYSGGEPTEAIDIIQECIEYGKHIVGNNLISEIQTNCYCDKDTIEYLAKNLSIIWVSLDGWPEIQSKNRPVLEDNNSAKKILNNALYLNQHTFVGIRCTIVPETVDKQVELINYFGELGFKYICSEPVFSPVKNDEHNPSKISCVDIQEYIKNFVPAWTEANKMGITYINSFMVNFDEKVKYACRSCLPTPHLTTDGYVSACDLGFSGDTPLKDLIYGKYNFELDKIDYWEESIKKLQTRICKNIPACKNCFAKDYCGGGCLGRMYHETRDFYGVIPDFCWATRYLAKNLPIDKIKLKYLHP